MRGINLIMLIILVTACKPTSVPTMPVKSVESIVAEKLGSNAIIQKNKDASFALCTKVNQSTLSLSYLIIRLHDLTIVEQDNSSRASLSWIDNFKIEIKIIPGIIKKEEQNIESKIIDVTKYMVQW